MLKRAALVSLTAVLGCGPGIQNTVTQQATFDLACDAENIEVKDIGGGAWGASGCGKKASYNCASGMFVGASCGRMGGVSGGSSTPAASNTDAPADAPKGAVGFLFGAARDATRSVCTTAGKTWTDGEKSSTCSGTPVDIGLVAHADLTFCADRLCAITVTSSGADLEAGVSEAYTSLLDGLKKKYGAPRERANHIPDACCSSFPCDFRANATPDSDPLVKCARDGRATFDAGWAWSKGERVHLLLDRSPGPLTLRIVYSTPTNAVHAKTEGL